MRLVFCGTAAFAVPSLRACADDHEVAAVVTRADRPGSRGRPAPRPVGDAASELGILVLTPLRIRYEFFDARMTKSDHIVIQQPDGSYLFKSGNPLVFGTHVSIEPVSGWSFGVRCRRSSARPR